MSNSKTNKQDIITSRITTTFFAFSLLSLFSWLYVLPFKKHNLIINDYYKIIEIIVISISFLFMLFTFVWYWKKKNSSNEKVIKPSMLLLYSIPAFLASVIIPLSNNRTMAYVYCIAAFLSIFIAYLTYYTINKSFVIYTTVCAIYCIAFALINYIYPYDVTFSDKVTFPHEAVLGIFLFCIIVISVLAFLINKKTKLLNFYYVLSFSAISVLAISVRFFVSRFISLIAIVVLVLIFVAISIIEKKGIKFKK